MITIEQMIQHEVLCCVSSLVATLANSFPEMGYGQRIGQQKADVAALAEQALELAAPVPDYEEAARQVGWKTDSEGIYFNDHGEIVRIPNWEAAYYNGEDVLPIDREVYEHWAVSFWLAEKLIAAGEKVDTDFAGLNVWARTTTGQAISMDGVIEGIYKEMVK